MLPWSGLFKRGIRSTFYTAYAYKKYRAHVMYYLKKNY